MSVFDRSKELLDPRKSFGQPAVELREDLKIRPPHTTQMILRMMVKTPTSCWQIPCELDWLAPTILNCAQIQDAAGIASKFVYITVRHGPVVSKTDDLWHVDGFSMRVPHPPEQNYIWANSFGTEVLNQEMTLPDDFDPMKHNIHQYFQDRANPDLIQVLKPKHLYVIDPYVIHRRPSIALPWLTRTFFRVSFVPIEIEDDTCTINPLMPRSKPYGRKDIRDSLIRYETK